MSVPEQLAQHLRREVEEGRLQGVMPGVIRLERLTGVNRKTVEVALRILEADGVLERQGAGKRRHILSTKGTGTGRSLRVGMLLFERQDRTAEYVLEIEHKLDEAGHAAVYMPKTLTELGMNLGRVERMIARMEADAWVVHSGSREVLDLFANRKPPVMAVFGRRRTLPIASVGPDKVPVIREVTRTLLELGHRRIVFLTRSLNRTPEPGAIVRAFLDELAAAGVTPGSYHLPDWVESVNGLDVRLKSLFRVTAPTAMIVDEAPFFVAARHFLGCQRLAVPEDVSLVCTDDDSAFAWCSPPVSHIQWDRGVVARRVAQWVSQVSKGKKDQRQTFAAAVFVRGGSIGPAKVG